MKFRVLVGRHVEGKHKDGSLKVYRARTANDIVESDVDLCAKFNQAGARKFERMVENPQYVPQYSQVPVQVAPVMPVEPEPVAVLGKESDVSDAELQAMTLGELRKMAEELELDLAGVKTKVDFIKLIQES